MLLQPIVKILLRSDGAHRRGPDSLFLGYLNKVRTPIRNREVLRRPEGAFYQISDIRGTSADAIFRMQSVQMTNGDIVARHDEIRL
jgi:hypothetical protein